MYQICFFEDELASNFNPLALTRPIDELRTGIFTIREKWLARLDAKHYRRHGRSHLADVFPGHPSGKQEAELWINARYLPDDKAVEKIKALEPGHGLRVCDTPVAALTNAPDTGTEFDDIRFHHHDGGLLLMYLWDLFQQNGSQIRQDFSLRDARSGADPETGSAILINKDQIHIGKDTAIDPGVIIDASEGPVYIGDRAHLMHYSVIKGPAAIGEGSTVKMMGRIYPDTTVGPVCKVAGEVENVIFQGYSNKAHDGFFGNSLIGEWCNIGADTNSSNLKNNYGVVSLADWQTGEFQDTGTRFIGTIMGDHTKTTINAMLNTGTVCGVCCNILASWFPARYIPSYSWIMDQKTLTYDFEKAMQTAERVMQRRKVELTPAYRQMMQSIYSDS